MGAIKLFGKHTKSVVSIIAVFTAICAALIAWRARAAPRTDQWWALAALQVLEGPDEVWVFTRAEKHVRVPDRLASPNIRTLATRQVVVVLDRDGLRDSFECANAPSFNTHIGTVFDYRGQHYIYTGGSMASEARLFVWAGRRFQQLGEADAGKLMNTLGIRNVVRREIKGSLDRSSSRERWHRVFADNLPGDFDVSCAQVGIRIWRGGGSRQWTVLAAPIAHDPNWVATILRPE